MATTRDPEQTEGAQGPNAATVAAVGAGAIGLVFAIAAAAIFDAKTALSVAVGAAIAVANLVSMATIVRALVRGAEEADVSASVSAESADDAEAPVIDHVAEGRRGGAAWGAFGVLKIIVLFGGVWLLLTKGLVDPIPLVVGYGVLPLGIVVSSLSPRLSPRARGGAPRARPRTK